MVVRLPRGIAVIVRKDANSGGRVRDSATMHHLLLVICERDGNTFEEYCSEKLLDEVE